MTYLEDIQIGHFANSLWRHVVHCPDLLIPLNVDRIIRNSFRNSEINNLQSPLDQNEIGGFEIGVNDVLLMNSVDSLQHLIISITLPQMGGVAYLLPIQTDKVEVEGFTTLLI
jgi:hypothetical protein